MSLSKWAHLRRASVLMMEVEIGASGAVHRCLGAPGDVPVSTFTSPL